MCGFAGFINWSNSLAKDALSQICTEMNRRISHRGPDSSGVWSCQESGVSIGHRRLAIQDISEHGHQPMHSKCTRFVLAFNGEIYNHLDMRLQLGCDARDFKGHSDTETLLAYIVKFGLKRTVQEARGMFSIALWDRKERKLQLATDRLGKKPLYFGWMGQNFMFGSEIKAFKAHPGWKPTLNPDALQLYLRYSYIPCPLSIYQGIEKLESGTIMTLSNNARAINKELYWDPWKSIQQSLNNPLELSDEQAAIEMERELREAIKLRTISDVPLGAFLSGGYDSTTIVALLQSLSSNPVKTFTIGFEESSYNEAPFAKNIARHLGTDHCEVYVGPSDIQNVIPKLSKMYDEPFADSSQLPTFLVSQIARQHVTVVLSGDGNDEILGGYNRHIWAPKIWDKTQRIPYSIRKGMARALEAFPPRTYDSIERMRAQFLSQAPINGLGEKIYKISNALRASTTGDLYRSICSNIAMPQTLLTHSNPEPYLKRFDISQAPTDDFASQMMFCDMLSYMHGDILTKVDRASMATSLEVRSPFIDQKFIEFCWRLPQNQKIRNGQSKWLTRQVLNKYVPQELMERPKAGFGVPISAWLRNDLKQWMLDILDPSSLKQQGIFNAAEVEKLIESHLSGRRNQQHALWSILMFQEWASENAF